MAKYDRGRPEDRIAPIIPTKKSTRYAMIRGWVERKYPDRRPPTCRPLTDAQIENIYQMLKGR